MCHCTFCCSVMCADGTPEEFSRACRKDDGAGVAGQAGCRGSFDPMLRKAAITQKWPKRRKINQRADGAGRFGCSQQKKKEKEQSKWKFWTLISSEKNNTNDDTMAHKRPRRTTLRQETQLTHWQKHPLTKHWWNTAAAKVREFGLMSPTWPGNNRTNGHTRTYWVLSAECWE